MKLQRRRYTTTTTGNRRMQLNYKNRKKTEDKKRRIWRNWPPSKQLKYISREMRILMHKAPVKAHLTSTMMITSNTAAMMRPILELTKEMDYQHQQQPAR
jgi:hypothetical protein